MIAHLTCHWHVIYICGILGVLLLEWWLPRKTQGRFNSTIDLLIGLGAVLALLTITGWLFLKGDKDDGS